MARRRNSNTGVYSKKDYMNRQENKGVYSRDDYMRQRATRIDPARVNDIQEGAEALRLDIMRRQQSQAMTNAWQNMSQQATYNPAGDMRGNVYAEKMKYDTMGREAYLEDVERQRQEEAEERRRQSQAMTGVWKDMSQQANWTQEGDQRGLAYAEKMKYDTYGQRQYLRNRELELQKEQQEKWDAYIQAQRNASHEGTRDIRKETGGNGTGAPWTIKENLIQEARIQADRESGIYDQGTNAWDVSEKGLQDWIKRQQKAADEYSVTPGQLWADVLEYADDVKANRELRQRPADYTDSRDVYDKYLYNSINGEGAYEKRAEEAYDWPTDEKVDALDAELDELWARYERGELPKYIRNINDSELYDSVNGEGAYNKRLNEISTFGVPKKINEGSEALSREMDDLWGQYARGELTDENAAALAEERENNRKKNTDAGDMYFDFGTDYNDWASMTPEQRRETLWMEMMGTDYAAAQEGMTDAQKAEMNRRMDLIMDKAMQGNTKDFNAAADAYSNLVKQGEAAQEYRNKIKDLDIQAEGLEAQGYTGESVPAMLEANKPKYVSDPEDTEGMLRWDRTWSNTEKAMYEMVYRKNLYGTQDLYSETTKYMLASPEQVRQAQIFYEYDQKNGTHMTEAFLEGIDSYLTNELKEYQERYARSLADDPFRGTVARVGSYAAKPITGLIGAVGTGLAALGVEGAQDTTGDFFKYDKLINVLREQQNTNAADWTAKTFGEEWRDRTTFVLGVVDSIADNLMAMAMGSKMAGVSAATRTEQNVERSMRLVQLIMSAEATSATMIEKLDSGMDGTEAAVYSVGDGIIEWLTERYSLEQILKPDVKAMLGKPKQLISFLVKSSTAEGSEEIASDLLNLGLDSVVSYIAGHEDEIRQRVNDYIVNEHMTAREAEKRVLKEKLGEIAQSGLAGALSGLGMAGGRTVANKFNQVQTGRNVRAEENGLQKIIDLAKGMEEGTESRALAEKLAGQKKVSNGELGKLSQLIITESSEERGEVIRGTVYRNVAEDLKAAGVENVSEAAEIITRNLTEGNEKLNLADRRALAKSEGAINVWKDYNTSSSLGSVKNKLDIIENTKKVNSVLEQTADLSSPIRTATGKLSQDIMRSVKSTASTAEAIDDFQQRRSWLMSESYAQLAKDLLESDKSTQKSTNYLDDVMKIRLAGMTLAKEMPQTQLENAAARALFNAAREEFNEADKGRLRNQVQVIPGKGTAAILGAQYGTDAWDDKLNELNVTRDQRQQLKAMAEIAVRMGNKLEVYNNADSTDVYGFEDSTGTIHVNLAGLNGDKLSHHMLVSMSHELTHWLEQNSWEGYNQLRSFVLDSLRSKGESIEDMIIDAINNQNKAVGAESGKALQITDAMKEIVAKSCENLLSSKALEAELRKTNPELHGKIRNFVKKFVARLRAAVQGMNGSLSKAARTLYNETEEIARLWLGARQEALSRTATGPLAEAGPEGVSFSTAEIQDMSAKELDSAYMQAVESGDMETVQRMVSEAAQRAGYTTPVLHHGTRAFGFTEFNVNGSGGMIFTTTDRRMGETYSGETQRTRITDKATIDAQSLKGNELLKEAQKHWKKYSEYRLANQEDTERAKADAREMLQAAAAEIRQFIDDNSERFDERKREKVNDIAACIENVSNAKTDEELYKAWDEYDSVTWFFKWEAEDLLFDILTDERSKSIYMGKSKLSDFLYDGDLYIADRYGNERVFDNQLALELDAENHKGVYELYGNPGKQLVMDADGSNWNNLVPPGELNLYGIQRTRDIANAAYANYYDSVLIKNVRDSGGETAYNAPADVYIFFDGNQLKSADPVTYDDAGNVIPLSERFQADNADIRYSTAEKGNKKGSTSAAAGRRVSASTSETTDGTTSEDIITQGADSVKAEREKALDEEYLKAIEEGDEKKQLQLIREKFSNTEGIYPFFAPERYIGEHIKTTQAIKNGDIEAIRKAAAAMAKYVPDNAVLIPMPSHTGTADENNGVTLLAKEIGRITGATVINAIEGDNRQSRYASKKHNKKGITAAQMGFRQVKELPAGAVPIIIDNVVSVGETAKAALDAIHGASVLSYTKGLAENVVPGLKAAFPTKDKQGNWIPLSQKGDVENTNWRYSTAEEMDSAYMQAVKDKDIARLQDMVDQAAENAGYTIRGNHGTVSKYFTVFDREYGNAEGDWGKGFYFTDDESDVLTNYASEEGADLQAKISALADKLEWMDGYEDASYEEREEKARELLAGGEPRVIRAALKMENPVEIGGDNETFFDYKEEYDEENDEYGEPTGSFVDLMEALQDVISEYDWIDADLSTLWQEAADYEGLKASDFEKLAKEALQFAEDEEGNLATNEIVREAFERAGYDGIADHTVAWKFGTRSGRRGGGMTGVDEGTTHYIVFNSTQIKQTDPITYDDMGKVIPLSERFNDYNPDIRWSTAEMDEEYDQAVSSGDTERQQELVYAAGAQAGYTIKAYHGTGRADRVGTVFRPERATSGPMAFFTDDRGIAENYARDKQDTSIAYDEEYGDYHTQFRVKDKKGKSIPVSQLWNTLSYRERSQILERAKHIAWDDEIENIIYDPEATSGNGGFQEWQLRENRGNAIETLINAWLDGGDLYNQEERFLEVLKLAGIENVTWNNPDARVEKVYDTLLKIQNPFSTSDMFNNEFIDGLLAWWDEQDQEKYNKESASADLWDKNNRTIEQWADMARDNVESGHTTVWTSIPDAVTDYLKAQGYDGIKDEGGKGGGRSHTVWIPFSSEQVKSADPITRDDAGNVIPLSERFNEQEEDIRWSTQESPDMEVNNFMMGLQEFNMPTNQEKTMLRQYKDLHMSLGITQMKIQDYEKKLRELRAIENPSVYDRDQIRITEQRIDTNKKRLERLRNDMVRATKDKGYARQMMKNDSLMKNLVNGVTADQMITVVQNMMKQLEELNSEMQERAKKLQELGENATVLQIRQQFNRQGLKRIAAQLKEQMNSEADNREIENRLALIALKMKEGKFDKETTEELVDMILGNMRGGLDTYVLNELRGERIALSPAQLKELKAMNSSIRELNAQLAGTGIMFTASGETNLEHKWKDLCKRITSLNKEENNLHMVDAIMKLIRDEMDRVFEDRFNDANVQGTTEMVLKAAAQLVPEIVTDAKSLNLIKETMQYAAQVAEQAKGTAAEVFDIDKAVERIKNTGRKVESTASTLTGDLKTAMAYFNDLSEQSEAALWKRERLALIDQLKSENTMELLVEREKWRQKIEKDQKAREQMQSNMHLRKQIHTNISRLRKRIINETDKKNVTEHMKPLAREVLSLIVNNDLSGRKLTGMEPTDLLETRRVLDVMNMMEGTFTPDDLRMINDEEAQAAVLDALADIEDGIGFYNNKLGKDIIANLQGLHNALEKINDGVITICNVISAENRITFLDREIPLDKAAEKIRAHMRRSTFKGERAGAGVKAMNAVNSAVFYGNMTPVYYFKMLRNAGLDDIWEDMQEGENRNGLETAKAKAYMQALAEKTGYKDWADKKIDVIMGGNKRTLSIGNIMELYAIWQREHTLNPEMSQHLEKGGVFIKQDEDNTGKPRREKVQQRAIRVGDGEILAMYNMLTDAQKEYIAGVVRYLSKDMSDLGNQASMRMYGIKKYKETYYFPMKVWDGVKSARSDKGITGTNENRAANKSWSKRRMNFARNALVIGDFTEDAVNHIQEMITYNTMAPAIENFNKVLNHKFEEGATEDDATTRNLRVMFQEAYGREALKYLETLMKDLNGGVTQDQRKTLRDKALTIFKKNAVAGSLSVVLQQPLSYIRASMLINPKYMATAPVRENWKDSYKEMMAHSGVAVIKDMGRFDMNFGQSAKDFITPETRKTALEKISEATTIAPELADRMTWIWMWNAVKAEQADQHKGMDVKSDKFLDIVGKRFNQVMRETQVYDSILVKSSNMRSQNGFTKLITSFMAEPTLSLNVLADAVGRVKAGDEKSVQHAIKAGATFMLSAILQAVFKGLMGSGRTPDEKKTWLENFLNKFEYNLINEANPLSLISGYSSLIETLKTGKLQDDAMGAIGKLYSIVQTTQKAIQGKGKGWYRDIEDTAAQLAQLFTNIPAKNLMRDARAVFNLIFQDNYAKRPTSGAVRKYQLEANIFNADSILGTVNTWLGDAGFKTSNKAYYSRMYEAQKAGNQAEADSIKEYLTLGKGVEEDTINSNLKTFTKADEGLTDSEKIKALRERGMEDRDIASWITKRYKEGELTKEQATKLYLEANPEKDKNDAYFHFEQTDWEKETGNNISDSDYFRLDQALSAGSKADYDKAVKELQAHGYKADKITDHTVSWIMKQYKEAKKNRKETETALKQYSGMKENDIYWKLDRVDYQKETKAEESVSGYYYRLTDAVNANKADQIQKAVKQLLANGITKEQIKGKLSDWKKEYLAASASEKIRINDAITKAYKAAGYTATDAQKTIDNWIKDGKKKKTTKK